MGLELAPVHMQSATQRVTLILREAIFTRRLLPGEKVTQNELAKQLNVSITPVREALMILETEQLVKIQPRKETIILGVTKKYLKDYWTTRGVIEGYLTEQVCTEKKDISEIEQAYQQMESLLQAGDYASYSKANSAFHQTIWRIADNQLMANLLQQIGVSNSMPKSSDPKGYAIQSFQEHTEIMKHLRDYNGPQAALAMRQHMERAFNDILSYYAETEDFSS